MAGSVIRILILGAAVLSGGLLLLFPPRVSAAVAENPNTDEPGENGLSIFNWRSIVNGDQNVFAFLAVIRAVEGGTDEYDYDDLFGGSNFTDYRDHPANLGWRGVRLPDGRLTTAAGAYQITRTTWNEYKDEAGVTDFSPASQDAFAIFLLKKRGAYELVRAGEFDNAVARLRNEWEAFARMAAGRYFMSQGDAKNYFVNSGGVLA